MPYEFGGLILILEGLIHGEAYFWNFTALHIQLYTGLLLSKNAHFIFAYFLLFCENLTTLATDLCRSSGNIVRSPRALTHTPCF